MLCCWLLRLARQLARGALRMQQVVQCQPSCIVTAPQRLPRRREGLSKGTAAALLAFLADALPGLAGPDLHAGALAALACLSGSTGSGGAAAAQGAAALLKKLLSQLESASEQARRWHRLPGLALPGMT